MPVSPIAAMSFAAEAGMIVGVLAVLGFIVWGIMALAELLGDE